LSTRRARALAAIAAGALAACTPVGARPSTGVVVAGRDTVRTTLLAPGVVHVVHRDAAGPWTVHVVDVDLARCACTIAARHAFDGLRGRERTSAMAARRMATGDTAIAGVNATFFDLRTGDAVDDEVIDGEWWRGHAAGRTPGPLGMAGPRAHAAFLADGRVVTGRMAMRARVEAGGASFALDAINPQRRGTLAAALYTDRFGAATPTAGTARDSGTVQLDADDGPPTPARLAAQARRDSLRLAADTVARRVVEVALEPVRAGGRASSGVTRWRVAAPATTGAGGTAIAPGGAVLSVLAGSDGDGALRALARGTVVTLAVTLVDADGRDVGAPLALVGGFGELLARGVDRSALADSLEGTRPSFSAARHPRTAVATHDRGRRVLLVTVDGRNAGGSVGMSLAELARWLRRLGATDAANLDGGGSTTLWLRGTGVANVPSDPTGERTVGNALFVVPRR
jgi:hypothetical protein